VVSGVFCAQMLPGFLLVFSAESGRVLYVSNSVSDELGHPVVSRTCLLNPQLTKLAR